MLVSSCRLEPIMGGLGGYRTTVDVVQVAIAEQEWQTRVLMPLGEGWWWHRGDNSVRHHAMLGPTRVRETHWNWIPYVRNGWYWKHQTVTLRAPRIVTSL